MKKLYKFCQKVFSAAGEKIASLKPKKAFKAVIILPLLAWFMFGNVLVANAALADYAVARVTFTFDDGFLSTYTNALPILSERGIAATIYPNTKSIVDGQTDDGFPALTWDQLVSLQNDYGWEVGGHSDTHAELPTLTSAQIAAEFQNSNAQLASHGLNVTNVATPFGSYDNKVLIEALKYYNTHRGFADRDTLNTFPYNSSVLRVQSFENNVPYATVKGWIDQAIANKEWLILVAHDVQPTYNANYEYTITNAEFEQIAEYVKTSGIKVDTVRSATKKPGTNLVNNGTFANGFNGFTTSNASQVKLDTANNGAFAEGISNASLNSISMTGGSLAAHLFSSSIANTPGSQYLIESFVNTTNQTAGEFGFYVDEYDASGAWTSGQWLGLVPVNTVTYYTKLYQPTSTSVATFSMQTYLTAGAAGTIYVDNLSVYNLNSTTNPDPNPTPTSNLLSNGSFETLTDGWANGWTKNNDAYSIDTNSQGNNGTNSLKVTANATNAHVFSELVNVDYTNIYTWKQDIKTTAATGEFGFYIDEYDANGAWISGQWKGMINAAFNGNQEISYIPTSANVKKAGLQYYAVAGSNFNMNIDSVEFNGPAVSNPNPTPTPTPTGSNLVVNGSFETVSGGFADNWTQDSTFFAVDSSTAGNDGANSMKLVSNSATAHLFSSLIGIETGSTYTWSQYVNALSASGEFGFYIDEYDVNGNWISGQWKGMINAAFTGNKTISYTPTSANVASVRLQYYAVAGSNFNLFLDSVNFAK